MRDVLFARRHLFDALLAIALGYGLFRALDSLTQLWIDVVVQHVGLPDFRGAENSSVLGLLNLFSARQGPALLSFDVGDTVVPYGIVVAGTSTLALVALAGLVIRRFQARCPHCRSVVAREASVCAACSLELEPAAGA